MLYSACCLYPLISYKWQGGEQAERKGGKSDVLMPPPPHRFPPFHNIRWGNFKFLILKESTPGNVKAYYGMPHIFTNTKNCSLWSKFNTISLHEYSVCMMSSNLRSPAIPSHFQICYNFLFTHDHSHMTKTWLPYEHTHPQTLPIKQFVGSRSVTTCAESPPVAIPTTQGRGELPK